MRVLPCRAATLSLCALALAGGLTPRRLSAQPSAADTAQLRRTLAEALGGELEIVRHELSTGLRERGGTFWLVHARPVRSGDYKLRYRYEYRDHAHPENPLYTHVEHESAVRVGERGCWRRREGKDICLGDTIILPFVVNDYAGHTFSFTRRDSGEPRPVAAWAGSADAPGDPAVPNPASRHLRYLGTRVGENPHRNGGCTIVHDAEFEAVGAGSFNLGIQTRWGGAVTDVSPIGSIPVVVVERGEPVTVLLVGEMVIGRNEKTGFSSTGGNQYLTTVLLLQPGDRISRRYLSSTRHRLRGAPSPPCDRATEPAASPAIGLFPFRLDPGERFNVWLAGHFPGQGAR